MPGTPKAFSARMRKHNAAAARAMRRSPTPTEDLLWECLRDRQIEGMKFRRQHPIDRFIVDFYCAEARLVIEVDGPIHDQPNADAERQAVLESLGLRVLRVANAAITHDRESVVAQIVQTIRATDAAPPRTCP